MDALIDLGRPKAIRLAVLVDRAGRNFPYRPTTPATKPTPNPDKSVQVLLKESDNKEQVIVQ